MIPTEKLSLWDRWFNRYRKTVHSRGTDEWYQTHRGIKLPNSDFQREWIEYLITDRITGSQTIEKVYIN